MISTIGRMPPSAAPIPAPTKADSESGVLLLEEIEHGPADAKPVAISVQLANRTLGPGLIYRSYLHYRHIELKGVNCEFRLDIQALRERREAFKKRCDRTR